MHGAVPVRRVALAAARPGRRPEQLRALRGGCDAARGAPTRLLLAGRPHNMASMVASAPMSSMRGMSNPGSSVGGFVSTVGGTSTSRGASGGSQMPMSAKEKLQRAQKLFTDSHSSDMVDRQVAAIMRICEQNQAGLLLQDLENLHPIVTLCNERIAEAQQHEFVEPLCQLLRLCMEPFLVTGVTEDERCSGALSQLLKSISRCLYCPVPRVQLTAAAALMPFVHVTDPDQEEKVNPVGARRARQREHRGARASAADEPKLANRQRRIEHDGGVEGVLPFTEEQRHR